MTNLLVRVDAHPAIGNGHLMRCLALSAEWLARVGKVSLLSYCSNPGLASQVIDRGVDFIPLDKPQSLSSDICETRLTIERLTPAWIVLDGYNFDRAYQQSIREKVSNLLVIDDTGHLPYYDARIILNQNHNADSVAYQCSPDTKLLLGTRYVLLRPEFLPWRTWKRRVPGEASRLLVTLGGADPDNNTLKVLEAVQLIDLKLKTKIVVGPLNPFLDELQKANSKSSVEIVTNVTQMAPLMTWADVAVTAGGVSCWECAFVGLPSLILVLAENQSGVAGSLDASGVAINLGAAGAVSALEIKDAITELCRSPDRRAEMSRLGRLLVDGNGAARLVDEMTPCLDLGIHLSTQQGSLQRAR